MAIIDLNPSRGNHKDLMGILAWLAAATAAHLITFPLRAGRIHGRLAEWMVAAVAALVAGMVATRLDFGGWNQPGLEVSLFAFLSAGAAVGTWRLFLALQKRAAGSR